MKNAVLSAGLLMCATALWGCATAATADMPHLEKRDGMTKLIVDGRPFICVAGEVHNSTSSDVEAMKSILPRLAEANLNTVLSVVSWDLIEPREGTFDFSMIDYQLQAARANHLRLIFLWMGSWKNGMSHYPPEWVKANQERFPRVVNAEGKTLEILSTFSKSNRDADARAFAAVMKHIREVDSRDHTVIAMQVENEVGLLGSSRDFSTKANAAFDSPVPAPLMDYLERNKTRLLPELTGIWTAAGGKATGDWEDVFGKNKPRPDMPPVANSPTRPARPVDAELFSHTDEIFMAWNYSRYIGYIAAQGKKEYPLPMYVNTWIVQTNDRGPGDYPSGGPEPLVHDIWRAGAPAIDILAPDIYLPQFADILRKFSRGGNPAFNPETHPNGNNCWTAFTQLNALCYSPFGIDNLRPESAFARAYGFVNSISGALADAQGKPDAIKLIQLADGQNPGRVELGDYAFDFTPVARQWGGAHRAAAKPAPAEGGANRGSGTGLPFLDAPFILIIHTAPNEYYFATNGDFPFRVSPTIPNGKIASAASIDRGAFKNGKWVLARRYNGDDIMGLGCDMSGAAEKGQSGTEIPLERRRDPSPGTTPTVLRVRFYQYR